MKKLYNEWKFKAYNKKRSANRNNRRIAYEIWKSNKRTSYLGVNKFDIKERKIFNKNYPKFIRVKAPEYFSFIKNTDEVIRLISYLKELYDTKQKVYVVLKDVKQIDYSAIVVLLSIMVKFKAKNIKFNGDMPVDIESREILEKSGFFENLYKNFEEKESYDISTIHSNGIHTHASKKVDSTLSSKVISSAAAYIWGEPRRCQGVQRALIELMQNTNNHAEIGKPGEKHWWLSVNQDKQSRKVAFSFVDFGVGIFTNLHNKTEQSKFFGWFEKMASKIKYRDNAQLLELILNGELHQTVTGKHYRGKGLPGIADVMRRNQISNLHIITNDVFSCPSNGTYKKLNKSFSGTFVYWELGEENESCK